MATTINADTSNGVVITPDTSGELELQSNGVTQLALTPSGIVSDLTVNGITVGRGGGDIATNTAIGTDALDNNTTGANNTGLGSSAGSTITTGSNNTLIGYDAEPSSATVSNEVTIGNASVDTVRMGNGDVVYPVAAGGFTNMQVFTSPGTWTNPGSVSTVKVTVVGAGGGGKQGNFPAGGTGGTSSFGAFCSATGGTGAYRTTPGDNYAIGGMGSGGNLNLRGGNASSQVLKGGDSSVGFGAVDARPTSYTSANSIATYGGGGAGSATTAMGGGGGGTAIEYIDGASIPGPVAVTIGVKGSPPPNMPAPNYNSYVRSAAGGIVIIEY